jgi:hypothetical protein
MHSMIQKLIAVFAFAVCTAAASPSFAATVDGKVTFVGSMEEHVTGAGELYARFQVRVSGSLCDGGSARDRWIIFRSGRMDGAYAHNLANTRNAFTAAMGAFLSGRNLEVVNGGISCSSTSPQTVSLWGTRVGVH